MKTYFYRYLIQNFIISLLVEYLFFVLVTKAISVSYCLSFLRLCLLSENNLSKFSTKCKNNF